MRLAALTLTVAAATLHGAAADDNGNDFGHLRWVKPTDDQETMWIVAGIAAGLGMLWTIVAIVKHMQAWSQPMIQTLFVRQCFTVLALGAVGIGGLIVPFASALFFAIRVVIAGNTARTYLRTLQAYFAPFHTEALRGARVMEVMLYLSPSDDEGNLKPRKLKAPLCGSVLTNEMFFNERVKLPVRVYQTVCIIIALLAMGFQSYGYMGVGSTDNERAWLGLVVVQLVFALVAAHSLISFFQVMRSVLVKPTGQLCTVLFVMLVFPLQEAILAIIATSGDTDNYFDLESKSISNTVVLHALICFEVLILAFITVQHWGPSPFLPASSGGTPRAFLTEDVALPDPLHTDDDGDLEEGHADAGHADGAGATAAAGDVELKGVADDDEEEDEEKDAPATPAAAAAPDAASPEAVASPPEDHAKPLMDNDKPTAV